MSSKSHKKQRTLSKRNNNDVSEETYELKYEELRGFIANESLFSHDSSLLFLFCNKSIYIHSVSTGKCICILNGHTSIIVSIITNPLNAFEIITLDKSGVLKIWDYLKQTCVKTIDIFDNKNDDTSIENKEESTNDNSNSNSNKKKSKQSRNNDNRLIDYVSKLKRTQAEYEINCQSLVGAREDNNNFSSSLNTGFTSNGVLFQNKFANIFNQRINSNFNENENEENLNKFVYCTVDATHVVRINLETSIVDTFIWNASQKRDFHGNCESIINICLTNNGKYLCVALHREISIISLSENNRVISYETAGWQIVPSIAFHPSNESLAFGDQRGSIHVWNDFQSLFEQSLSHNKNNNNSNNKSKHNNKQHQRSHVQSLREWLTGYNTPNNMQPENEDTTDTKMGSQHHHQHHGNKKRHSNYHDVSNGSNKHGPSRQNEYLMRQYHWHAHKVRTISFTTDGAYMISGGEEAVLVMTQLETNRHQFLPRLGGTIAHISVSKDEIKFGVCLDSNQIRIIDSVNNKILRTIEGISLLHRLKPSFDHLLQRASMDPKNKNSILIPSLPGFIQFYDLQNDVSRGILQLVKYPQISRTQEKEPDRYVAQFMVLNNNGTRLVTVVKRECESILGIYSNNNDNGIDVMKCEQSENNVTLVTLQVFHYHSKSGYFVLNTRIDSPHNTNEIAGISFHPNKNRFLTYAHGDETFRIWEEHFVSKKMRPKTLDSVINSEKGNNNSGSGGNNNAMKRSTWRSQMSGYYQKDAVTCADFSNDGTILFVAANDVLTLWNSENLMLLKRIEQTHTINAISVIKHIPFIVTLSDQNKSLNIWDLTTCTLHWNIDKFDNIYDFVVIPSELHPTNNHCIVVAAKLPQKQDSCLLIYDIEQKKVVQEWILPNDICIDKNSLVVYEHENKSQLDSMADWKDIDIMIISKTNPMRIPCIFLQYEGRESNKYKTMFKNENESKNELMNDSTKVSKYLDSLNANKSIFEKLFGKHGLTSNGESIDSMDSEQLFNEKRKRQALLKKLNPVGNESKTVIDDMFDGPVHTLPSLNSMFDQYMSYFVPTQAGMAANELKNVSNEMIKSDSQKKNDHFGIMNPVITTTTQTSLEEIEKMNQENDESKMPEQHMIDDGDLDSDEIKILDDNEYEMFKQFIKQSQSIRSNTDINFVKNSLKSKSSTNAHDNDIDLTFHSQQGLKPSVTRV